MTSGKRWVLWQIPEGNSNIEDMDNTASNAPRAGYKDNRSEYFFGPGGATHRKKFASSGVIALLFGRGEGRQASHLTDVYTDGQLFLKSRAGAFLTAGGLAIPAGSTSPPTPPTTPTPPPTPRGELEHRHRAGPRGRDAAGQTRYRAHHRGRLVRHGAR